MGLWQIWRDAPIYQRTASANKTPPGKCAPGGVSTTTASYPPARRKKSAIRADGAPACQGAGSWTPDLMDPNREVFPRIADRTEGRKNVLCGL